MPRAQAHDLSCTAAERAWAALLAIADDRCPEQRNPDDYFGLDAAGLHNQLAPFVSRLSDAGIRVSLFIDSSDVAEAKYNSF